MKLSQVRKKHIYTEQGEESVIATYLDWRCLITVQGTPNTEAQLTDVQPTELQFKVDISAYNYDADGNTTSGCIAGKMIHLTSIAELKELVAYYLDRVEMSCEALLELAEYYGEVLTLEELLD